MVKTITIKETTYLKLRKMKKGEESFSDLFDRLAERAAPIEVLARIRGSIKLSNKRKLIAEIYSKRSERR